MSSNRRQEGYLLIDNRHAPGPTEAMINEMRKAGHEPFVAPASVFETSTITCKHCCTILIKNPKRTRPREWCSKCDRFICDACAYIAKMHPHSPHLTMDQRIDNARNLAVKSIGKV